MVLSWRLRGLVCGMMGIVGAGCAVQQVEDRIDYERNNVVRIERVLKAGDYGLYTAADINPQVVRHLNAGDRIGFVKKSDGTVEAVAGDYASKLNAKAYWKYYGNR